MQAIGPMATSDANRLTIISQGPSGESEEIRSRAEQRAFCTLANPSLYRRRRGTRGMPLDLFPLPASQNLRPPLQVLAETR